MLRKILEGQTKSIMVFLKVAYFSSRKEREFLQNVQKRKHPSVLKLFTVWSTVRRNSENILVTPDFEKTS